jgi:1,4-dihydroxy-2-naphthoate octaprenyltransferase
MNRSTIVRRSCKIGAIFAMLVMCFVSLEVVIGLTSFYTKELTGPRWLAFVIVAVFPIMVGAAYAVANRRSDKPSLSLMLTLGALACDLVLVSFANGRL